MKHTEMMGLSRHKRPQPFHNGLRCLLVLTTALVVAGFGRLDAEERTPATTEHDAIDAETVTAWPRRITIDGWAITVYQPQPERLDGNTLTARAAISVAQGDDEPVFGAGWMDVRLDIDREQRIANAASLTIDRIQFPAGETGNPDAAAMKDRLQRALVPADLTFNLDDLIATLEQEPTDRTIYSVVPPRILIRTTPTELVPFDGPPRFETAGGVTLAVNTPAFVCVDGDGAWWLHVDNGWLTAPGSMGPWVLASAPPAMVAAAEAAGLKADPEPTSGDATAPAVIIATEPTELVAFTGEPQWTPIADTGILAADNSDSDAFIDTSTRRYWLLLAGRWFSAERLADDASWIAVAPNALPAGFAAIPADSRWAHVRVHISGTEEARKAALDAQVPQTARIPRSATITVTYDGEPRFIAIPASEVAWADNSSFAVFRTPGPRYWCCHQGVWYQAEAADGPWAVATDIPATLHRIPADNPYHHVTYVHVYDSGPDYVWTGYTSGYVHHYFYLGCPIYGSGWYWRGYYGRPGYACPRPITWGVRVRFSPTYYGWGIGTGIRRGSCGGVSFVRSHAHAGWWGPVGHTPPPVIRPGLRPPSRTDGWHASAVHHHADHRNPEWSRGSTIYRRVPGAQLPSRQPRPAHDTDARAVIRDPGAPVYVARDGSLVRRGNAGAWQERNNRTWTDLPTTAATADRGQTRQHDQRLPRVATRLPTPQQRPPATPRPRQDNRPEEPPAGRTPPINRPPQQQPPRRQDDPRPQQPGQRQDDPPIIRPEPRDRPPQQPPRRQDEPRPQQPGQRQDDPPINRPEPRADRPPQQPPRRQDEPRPQQPGQRQSDPPSNRPEPRADRPPQQPPTPQNEPRPQVPDQRPVDPPSNRPELRADRPPQQPPRRQDEPRPQQPNQWQRDPPINRPEPRTDRPPQQPPRWQDEPRPQQPTRLPAGPPTHRSPPIVDRPPQQPSDRQPREPRPPRRSSTDERDKFPK